MPSITINRRFCGPPASGNGGYTCGLIAKQLKPLIEVRLTLPPPLDTSMSFTTNGVGGGTLSLGDKTIARATPAQWTLETPTAPSHDEVCEAEKNFVGFHHHPLPGCFVCGPKRAMGDGLRIFAGRLKSNPSAKVFAATWHVDPSLGHTNGIVHSEFIWAALDCPGYFAVKDEAGFALLGSFSATIERDIHIDDRLIAIAWPIDAEGRKHRAGSAIFDKDNQLIAKAIATWISVPEETYTAATE